MAPLKRIAEKQKGFRDSSEGVAEREEIMSKYEVGNEVHEVEKAGTRIIAIDGRRYRCEANAEVLAPMLEESRCWHVSDEGLRARVHAALSGISALAFLIGAVLDPHAEQAYTYIAMFLLLTELNNAATAFYHYWLPWESDENGISPGYSFEGIMLGHIVQGVKVLDRQMSELDFPEEKKIMIEHMVLSHHYEPEFGSPKRPLFPEAEMLHYLDNMDAKMFDFEDAMEKTKPGEFSDRVWTLNNRRLYRKKD